MLTIDFFEKQLHKLLPDYRNHRFLLAVSGGADSMVLLDLCHQLKLPVEVAHVNYNLRGEHSIGDRMLVEETCTKFDIPIHIYEVTAKDEKPEGSIQNWARELRYTFFRNLQKERNLAFLMTAHHLNDQLETFIIHLSKASGLQGLSGIPANENNILRPLLHVSKQDIYDFAEAQNIPYREDASNHQNYYLRNKIRNIIVPELEKLSPHFLQNFDKSIQYIQEAQDFVNAQLPIIRKEVTIKTIGEEVYIDKEKLQLQNNLVRYEFLKRFGFENAIENEKIFSSGTGKQFRSSSHRLLINRNELIITPIVHDQNLEDLVICNDRKEAFEKNRSISIIFDTETDWSTETQWEFDLETLKFPLSIGTAKEGDLIYPTGMEGKKKVSKFYKDIKLSILAKNKTKVLRDSEGNILGIIPFRQDRRWKKKDSTYQVLTIILKKDTP